MLNNIRISNYIKTNSLLQKLNPLNKILTLIIFLFISLLTNNIYIHLGLIVYLLILILISKINIKVYLLSFKTILFLLVAIFLINLLFNMNIITNIVNILKIIEMIIYSSLLTITTSSMDLIGGLNILLKPLKIFKINTNEISYILMLGIKFIPLVIDQINIIIKTLLSKGINLKNSKHKILILKSIIIPTINNSLRKADLVADSLILKSYNINEIEINNKWKVLDITILIVYLICLLFIIGGKL